MSVDGTSNCNADGLANTLFTTLTTGNDFSLPAVDLTDPSFTIPAYVGAGASLPLTEADLTQRVVGGTGMFDGLMVAMSQHLRQEYEKGRITGQEYSAAYISMSQNALQSSVQYLLQKDTAYWQAQLVQSQARTAEVALIAARVELEVAKASLAKARLEVNTVAANYALSKLQLATEDAKYCNLLAATQQTEYQTGQLMPAQLGQVTAETAKTNYEVNFLLPKELVKADKGIELITSQISTATAQKDQILYQTASILPAQKTGYDADNATKDYQLNFLMPAQTAGYTKDNEAKAYTNTFLLPEQLVSLKEQNEGHRSKTLDTRMDGVTPITGAIGKQKELHAVQVDAYKRDSETKVAKMLLDTWIAQLALNELTPVPDKISNDYINSALVNLRSNLAI